MNSYRGPVAQILDVNEAQVLPRCFFRAAAPFLPNSVRTAFGRCAIVLFFRAEAAAFLMFLRAAARCF